MLLILDLGSSSTRAAVYDDYANAIDDLSVRVPMSFAVGDDGRCEDDAVAAFDRVVQVLDELHTQLLDYQLPVTDLGISLYASSLVCLDVNADPISPVFTYADTRCATDARRLREQHDELEALQRTGCRIRANYLPAKIAWIQRTLPGVFARTHWFASLSDYVILRLFGPMSARAGISIASWTGLLNREASDWDEAWLHTLDVRREQFPAIRAPSPRPRSQGEREPELRPTWQTRWPRFAQVHLHAPVGDGAAANIGSGCTDASRIAITIGTTAAMRVVRSLSQRERGRGEGETAPPLPTSLWSYRVDHTHDLIGGATTEGGSVVAWARKTLQLEDAEAVERASSTMQPDAHGLTVLPTFAGERSPGYAEDIHGTLHGLSLNTRPIEITRALMEGVAYRLAHICDALLASGVASSSAMLVGSGGALLASPTWCQIVADVCGVPLEIADVPEATSRGVAQLAIGNWQKKVSQLPVANSKLFKPNDTHHNIYRAAMARQQELYAKLV